MNKKLFLVSSLLIAFSGFSQEHFSGISTSNRVGILNGSLNPAEFANLSKKFEVNIIGISTNVSDNQIGLKDITSGANIEQTLFQGNKPLNANVDSEIMGPGFAMKMANWGFAVTSKVKMNFDIIDVDPTLGNALINNDATLNVNILNSNNTQRINEVSYGEIGFSASRILFETDKYQFSGGATFKMLFPNTYSNFSLSSLNGNFTQDTSGIYLSTNQPTTVNIAYSQNLTDNFIDIQNFSKNLYGQLNGFAGDFGATFKIKGDNEHKLKIGIAIRNIGALNFNNGTNSSTNYTFDTSSLPGGKYNLNDFVGIKNVKDIEQKLISDGVITKTTGTNQFKVKLPTTFTSYADIKIMSKLSVTAFFQQKINNQNDTQKISIPNIYSVTPRINLGFFETYLPVAINEISGTNVGIGFRLGGFYLGSGSAISALISNSKQIDFYTGFRWAFL